MSMKKTDLDKLKGKKLDQERGRKGRTAPPDRTPGSGAPEQEPLAVRLIRQRQQTK
jgi:hypothetical protein